MVQVGKYDVRDEEGLLSFGIIKEDFIGGDDS